MRIRLKEKIPIKTGIMNITPEEIESVKSLLPSGMLTHNIHKSIAKQLNYSNAKVKRCIYFIIKKGL